MFSFHMVIPVTLPFHQPSNHINRYQLRYVYLSICFSLCTFAYFVGTNKATSVTFWGLCFSVHCSPFTFQVSQICTKKCLRLLKLLFSFLFISINDELAFLTFMSFKLSLHILKNVCYVRTACRHPCWLVLNIWNSKCMLIVRFICFFRPARHTPF